VADVLKLLDQLGIADAVFFGTSLGAICTMLLASTDADRIAGAMLNDIGPEIDQTGIDRIGGYVGREVTFDGWAEAISTLAERNREVFPKWGPGEWDRFARRIMHETPDGIRFQYDMRIADNFRVATEGRQGASWHLYESLAGRPVTILRGALSDLLAEDIADQMVERLDGDAELVVVPDVGHTPNLEEPESTAAMDRLLERVMDRQED
jgi:pimeloyl-ACP methyl ester carboxylesterase